MAGKWVMFDLETLGTGPESIIVSLGACRFDEDTAPDRDTMALLLDMESQYARARAIDLDTVVWWMQQSQEARDWNFNRHNRYPVDVALRAFCTFCEGAELFWSRGTNFDPILGEDLFKQYGMIPPWKFFNVRDVRTLDHFDDGQGGPQVAHKPLDDAIAQAEQVRRVFKRFADGDAAIFNSNFRIGAEPIDSGMPSERLVPRKVD